MVDGRIYYDIILDDGRKFGHERDAEDAVRDLRITSATLTSVELRGGNVAYTMAKVEQAYTLVGLLQQEWLSRDGRLRTPTGVRLSGDGLDYEVLDGGRPGVMHETEIRTLSALGIFGARIVGAELKDGNVYFTLAESNFTRRG